MILNIFFLMKNNQTILGGQKLNLGGHINKNILRNIIFQNSEGSDNPEA
jgi:hypothetical protein